MSKSMSIECKNLIFKYSPNAKKEVVKGFSYNFTKGAVYLITGFSGCGKSTLAYILAGLYPENKGVLVDGSIVVEGVELSKLTPQNRVKKISMMFQNADTQFCMGTVREELIFTLENIGYPKERIDAKIAQVLRICKIENLEHRELVSLSGGEKQKVALAGILALESNTIILDEPFANIDYESSQEIVKLLKELNEKSGKTLIIIDHRLSLWKDIEYSLITLEEGCKISNRDIRAELSDRNYTKKVAEVDMNGERKLQIRGLELRYGKNILGSSLDLDIVQGKITTIIGKSGSGKTTFLKILGRILKYRSGSITIDGVELKKLKEREILQKIGVVFQNPQNQFITYKVKDELLFTLNNSNKKNRAENERVVQELLKEFSLYEYKEMSPYTLSQGQQRKVAVLSMLSSEQEILLCDEPTYGQDNRTSRELMEYLRKRSKEGVTIVLVSHDINLIAEYSDYIYELEKGELRRVEYV